MDLVWYSNICKNILFPANLPWRPNKLRGSSATQRSASYYYHLSTRRALRETKLVPLGPSYSRFPRILTIFLSVSGVWSVGGGEDTSPVNIWSIVRYILLICDIIIFLEFFFKKSKIHSWGNSRTSPLLYFLLYFCKTLLSWEGGEGGKLYKYLLVFNFLNILYFLYNKSSSGSSQKSWIFFLHFTLFD